MKGDKLSAELAWFHVFKAMTDDGEVAKIGPSAFTTYCATGVAFPSIETISQKSGISQAQVKRDLKTLEANGLLTKEKQWKSNVYTLREKILITDEAGKPAGQATWDYLPDAVRGAVADLKNVLMTGQFRGCQDRDDRKLAGQRHQGRGRLNGQRAQRANACGQIRKNKGVTFCQVSL
jgi:DNA-binding transcriptional MocR family regulator